MSQFLTNGTCVDATTCSVMQGVKQCAPPAVIQIVPCPDNCTNNGLCTNITVDAHCFNNIQDSDETDIDCGGSICSPCKPGSKCKTNNDCFTNLCDNTTFTCGGAGFFAPSGNTTQKCVCNTGFSGSNCGVSQLDGETISVIVAGTLGTLAIIGIIVGIIVCCAVAGGTSMAVYNRLNVDEDSFTAVSPLFEPATIFGASAIYEAPEGEPNDNSYERL